MDNRKVILSPINSLLKSRKFIVAVGSLLVAILIRLEPSLINYSSEITNWIVILASVFIGGTAVEDALNKPKVEYDNEKEIKEISTEVIKQALIDLGIIESDENNEEGKG